MRAQAAVALALISLLFASAASGQTLYVDPQFGFNLTTSVVFAQKDIGNPASTIDLHLELYEPIGVGVPSDRPVLIGIHGGGFTGGNRFSARIISICEEMAMRGYTCVSIDYRLDGQDPVVGPDFLTLEALIAPSDPRAGAIAAATEDTLAAAQWLLDNQVALDISPHQLGLYGSSAGGVLTAIVGYLSNEASFPRPLVPMATFNMWGAIDPGVQSLGPGDPSVLIVHGDQDPTVPVASAYALDAQAAVAGIPHELHVFAGEGHGFDIFTKEVAPGETVFDRYVTWTFTHVASVTVPAVPFVGLALGGAGILAASWSRIGRRRRSARRAPKWTPEIIA